jgi:hypothetical protein
MRDIEGLDFTTSEIRIWSRWPPAALTDADGWRERERERKKERLDGLGCWQVQVAGI